MSKISATVAAITCTCLAAVDQPSTVFSNSIWQKNIRWFKFACIISDKTYFGTFRKKVLTHMRYAGASVLQNGAYEKSLLQKKYQQ